jgi:hypothetical protein
MATIRQIVAVNALSDIHGNLDVVMGSMSPNSEIVILVQCQRSGLFTLGASDTKGNSYSVQRTGDDADNTQCAIITAPNVNSGANTITLTEGFDGLFRFLSGFIYEVDGLTASPVDACPVINTGNSSTAAPTSTGTLAQATETALVCVFGDGSATIADPSGGPTWTDSGFGTLNDTDGRKVRSAYATVAATTALAPTSALGASEGWLAAIITLKSGGMVAGWLMPGH